MQIRTRTEGEFVSLLRLGRIRTRPSLPPAASIRSAENNSLLQSYTVWASRPLFGRKERQKRDKTHPTASEPVDFVAVPTGFEPVTFGLGNRCSILLSYGTGIEPLA
jgi:hypothetical protein